MPAHGRIGKARALHFLKKFALRGRKSGRKVKDTVSTVAIPTQDCQRAHSSVDLLRKPAVSPLIGFRVEDGPNPMDTDDSSQDASASGNSSPLRPRRHSAWDALRSAPIHSTFAGHDAAPLFFRDQATSGDQALVDDPGKLLAPAPLFSRSNTSLDAGVQPVRSAESSPEISPQISVAPEATPYEEAVPDTPKNDTTRRSGDVYPHNDTLMNPPTDPTPSTSSDSGNLSRTQSLRAMEVSTSKSIPTRPPLVPRHSAPLPPPFRVTTERGLRLSPSIITRQPIPLLNLPALPPPLSVPDSPPRRRVPLRSMPSLSRHGHSNTECQADHETATLGDSDEDDEGDEEEFIDASSVHQSDDEDDEPRSAGPSTQGFKTLQKQPMRDDGSVSESPISPMSPQNDTFGTNLADCSCSKTYVQPNRVVPLSTSLEMYPFSPNVHNIEDVTQRHPLNPGLPIPGASRLENGPSLYRVASRSMVNLGSTRRVDIPVKSRGTVGSNPASTSGHTSDTREESEESDTEVVIGRLLRRTSMPSFHPTSDPPPYPTFNPRPKETAAPREDEGREQLPPYSNSLYLIAIMPRKMEFISPGVQAKDRKWRRVVCELEGTTFRIYKCPPGASGAGVLGDWWEKHVGVGDVAGPNPPRKKKGTEEPFERPAKLSIDDPPTTPTPPTEPSGRSTSVPPARRRTGSQSSMTTQSTMTFTPRPAKRMSAASFLSPFRSASTPRGESSIGEASRPQSHELELLPVDMQESRSSLSHESNGRTTPVASSRRISQPPQPRSASRLTFLPVATGRTPTWRNGEIPKPPKSDLVRAYTLQHAESGLGNDYLKRKNVVRVRLEGEQFLLQAPNVPAVVEWIEVDDPICQSG